jgi:A/G-specific adenine glycosylase
MIDVASRTRTTIQEKLLYWFDHERRDLPWRKNVTPYRVWISEVMLQQTQVSTVLPYFRAFLRRFPSVRVLAEATTDEVMDAWSGLGYYRRARSLHEAAKVIVKEYNSRFPRDLRQALALPGVGRYTAGAVLSIAYAQRYGIVDANVKRVLRRLFAVLPSSESGANERILQELADILVSDSRPGDFNQAIMELGAQVCTPRDPGCTVCPISRFCVAFREGSAKGTSATSRKGASRNLYLICLLIHKGGKILIVRDRSARWYADLWHLPFLDTSSLTVHQNRIVNEIRRTIGLTVKVNRLLLENSFSITVHKVKQKVVSCTVVDGRIISVRGRSTRWISPASLGGMCLPSSQRPIQSLPGFG